MERSERMEKYLLLTVAVITPALDRAISLFNT